jgi:Asp-tRNA(Asn)/Glu-tRNA(Gln) amidotransferase A subunit family amidase
LGCASDVRAFAALPLGAQLVGASGHDARFLRAANALIEMLAPKKNARRAHARG